MNTHSRSALAGLLAASLVLPLSALPLELAAQARAKDGAQFTSPLVSTAWVARHIGDPGVVLLHVGTRSEFADAHLPGAVYADVRTLSTDRGGLSLELPEPAALRESLERLGVSDDSRIVVYVAKDWVSLATRLMLTLDWIGLGAQSALLDGGLPQWRTEGRAISNELTTPARGRLTARPIRDLVVDHAFVQRSIRAPGIALVDARAPMFYDGPPHGEHRAGHIPGAVNIPFTSVFGEDVKLLSADSLTAIFRAAGVKPGDTIVAYCHIGQQATAVLFAARVLGHPIRLYDGSFDDWSARKELPVEGGRPSGGHQDR